MVKLRYLVDEQTIDYGDRGIETLYRATFDNGEQVAYGTWEDEYTASEQLLDWISRDGDITEQEHEYAMGLYEFVNDI